MLNADLAVGHDLVLILAPIDDMLRLSDDVAAGMKQLQSESEIRTVRPDEASTAAFGSDLLSPASREPSARAGRIQGLAMAASLRPFWV